MQKFRVYVETSVISYLASRPSRDPLTRARQIVSERWWEAALQRTALESSEWVRFEIARGNQDAAMSRLRFFAQLTILPIHNDSLEFAQRLIAEGLVPATEPEDAGHIAQAVLTGADYIASWNFAHLVNPHVKLRLFNAIERWGYRSPVLVTPEEMNEGIFV